MPRQAQGRPDWVGDVPDLFWGGSRIALCTKDLLCSRTGAWSLRTTKHTLMLVVVDGLINIIYAQQLNN